MTVAGPETLRAALTSLEKPYVSPTGWLANFGTLLGSKSDAVP
ncbi:MAG: hypothetical protein N2595_11070 [bacterium]|nr:hypothetical protein [bacterium]